MNTKTFSLVKLCRCFDWQYNFPLRVFLGVGIILYIKWTVCVLECGSRRKYLELFVFPITSVSELH